MRIALIAALLLLAGCGEANKTADAMRAISENCNAPLRVELHAGGFWGNKISLYCDDIKDID